MARAQACGGEKRPVWRLLGIAVCIMAFLAVAVVAVTWHGTVVPAPSGQAPHMTVLTNGGWTP